jgi:hypothetical protein
MNADETEFYEEIHPDVRPAGQASCRPRASAGSSQRRGPPSRDVGRDG